MEFSTNKKWFVRTLVALIACACLGGMLLAGRDAKGVDITDSPWPYVVFRVRPVQLNDWESVDELREFLNTNVIRIILISNEPTAGNCEDHAIALRDAAALRGKYLGTETLTRAECYKYNEYLAATREMIWAINQSSGHMLCNAIIGNELWFIEPANNKIWKAYNLD